MSRKVNEEKLCTGFYQAHDFLNFDLKKYKSNVKPLININRLGINMALTGLFGGTKVGNFLGFANGGRPPVGRASIVGEKGPELFIPKTSGTIIPNNQIGGAGGGIVNNINVNVSTEGMQSNANEDRGKELGVALASAIQSELIKQKRPGGLLAT